MTEDIRKGKNNFDEAHKINDLDFGPNSFHHTLGNGPLQAAPGKHTHKALPVSTNTIVQLTPGAFAEGILLSPVAWPNDNATGISWVIPGTTAPLPKAQAGIYVQQNLATGTRMHFATTDNYTTGQKTALSINEAGTVVAQRGEMQANGWFRTITGQTGWYSQPYAVGIYPVNNADIAATHAQKGTGIATYPPYAPFYCGAISMYSGPGYSLNIDGGNLVLMGGAAPFAHSGYIQHSTNVMLIWEGAELLVNDNARSVWRTIKALSFAVMSSGNSKTDIRSTGREGIKTLLELDVRDFRYSEMTATPDKVEVGLIAEEVDIVYPPAVVYDTEFGVPTSIDYGKFSPLLIKAVQEIVVEARDQIKALKQKVTSLEQRVAALEAKTA